MGPLQYSNQQPHHPNCRSIHYCLTHQLGSEPIHSLPPFIPCQSKRGGGGAGRHLLHSGYLLERQPLYSPHRNPLYSYFQVLVPLVLEAGYLRLAVSVVVIMMELWRGRRWSWNSSSYSTTSGSTTMASCSAVTLR